MIKKISCSIVNKLSKNGEYTSDEIEKMVYSLMMIITDGSKLVILMVLYLLLDYGVEFIILFILTILLRINIGGFHLKKYLSCLLLSGIYFYILIYLNNIDIRFIQLVTTSIICLLILIIFAPVIPPQRQGVRSLNKNRLKAKGSFFSSIYIIIYIVKDNYYTQLGVWVVIIQTILILILKGVNTNEKIRIKRNGTINL